LLSVDYFFSVVRPPEDDDVRVVPEDRLTPEDRCTVPEERVTETPEEPPE
jgi:hypothetical protein